MSKPKPKSEVLEKVGDCLYRMPSTGAFYARVWQRGKEIRRTLKTKDRQLAKRRLADFRREVEQLDLKAAKTTLEAYVATFLESAQFRAKSTRQKQEAIARRVNEQWPDGSKVKLADVKHSDVLRWLHIQREAYAPSHYNEHVQFIRKLFACAVRDKLLMASPAEGIETARRDTPIRDTPTWEEFRAIVEDMRSQKRNARSLASADCCEFMGLAGLGNAECEALTWGDIDMEKGRIRVYRKKTDTGFMIPIYPQLRPLIERLHGDGPHAPDEKVLSVGDIRKSLKGACDRLGYKHFTARSLRRCFITRAVELGIDFKTIAGMQGHKDGGVLIAKTYSHLRNEHLDRMAEKLVE